MGISLCHVYNHELLFLSYDIHEELSLVTLFIVNFSA